LDNKTLGAHTGYEFMPNEGPIPLRAVEPTELVSMVLHKF